LTISPAIKKRLLSGGAWALLGKAGTAIGALAVNALLARLLTPEEMGVYFLTYSLVMVASTAAQLGLNQAVVKLIAESIAIGRLGRAADTVRFATLGGAVGIAVVAAAFGLGGWRWLAGSVFSSPEMAALTSLAVLWMASLTWQVLMGEHYRGFHDIRLASVFGGLFTTLLSAGLFALLWIGQGHSNLHQVLVLSIGAGFANAVLASAGLWMRSRKLAGSGHLGAKEVVKLAWPMLLTSLTFLVLTQADLWIVGALRSQQEVAVYGAAARLVLLVAMPLMIANAVVPPLVAEMHAQGNTEQLERSLRTTATVAGIPSFLVLLTFIFAGGPLLQLVFGDAYGDGAPILALLCLGQMLNVWAGSCGVTLMMTGYQTTMLVVTIFSGLLSIAGALLLVGPWGPVGVAAAAAAAMMVQNVLMLIFVKRAIGVWTHMRFVPGR